LITLGGVPDHRACSAAVDDALQVTHEHQLRGSLVIDDPGGEHVGVLTPERGELTQQQLEIQPAIAFDETARIGDDLELQVGREHPDDDLTVDWVGDTQRRLRRD
jgi:hypothetical protein